MTGHRAHGRRASKTQKKILWFLSARNESFLAPALAFDRLRPALSLFERGLARLIVVCPIGSGLLIYFWSLPRLWQRPGIFVVTV